MKDLANFIYELGQLKRIRHEGWRLIGINNPETVAAHTCRAAQIAYFLAKLASYEDPGKVVTMVVFHDQGETRIGDLHKVAQRYVQADERRVVEEQVEGVAPELLEFWDQVEGRTTEAGNLAKDADLLEQAVTAQEYMMVGYQDAERWYAAVGRHLETEVAKQLYVSLGEVRPIDWWQDLKKYDK